MKNFIVKTPILLLFITLSTSQTTPNQNFTCPDACFSCQGSTGIPYCNSCIGSVFDSYEQECATNTAISNTNCLVYSKNSICQLCTPGYSLYKNSEGQGLFCIKDTHSGLEQVKISQALSYKTGQRKVFVCKCGFPSKDYSGCENFKAFILEDEALGQQSPSANCDWGLRQENGYTACYRCVSGYVVNKYGDEILSGGNCILAKSGQTGCLQVGKSGDCKLCDIWNGYFMSNGDGVCKKIQNKDVLDMILSN